MLQLCGVPITRTTRDLTDMTEAIDYFNSDSLLRGLATRLALRARCRMYERFVALADVKPSQRLLDLGVTPDTRLPDSNFPGTLIRIAAILRWRRWRIVPCSRRFSQAQVCPTSTPCALPFADRAFDISFSSAVLEHVGGQRNNNFFCKNCCAPLTAFF